MPEVVGIFLDYFGSYQFGIKDQSVRRINRLLANLLYDLHLEPRQNFRRNIGSQYRVGYPS